ncbi:MAG: pyridoxamine 5'-phosphate oxidase family protein [Desulfuromonadales bacterium]|nr:pyridoxamine 5'-phosphate oxidase family protein [Desulfuromonadales bacterium]MBN2792646.1 pyridoxamine 5'-phosphate oxidase family protein [Desulfuromonadales bacterium]
MRRQEKAVTALPEIEAILKAGKVCQLAFADEPVPYIVSLNYGYSDGALYFHSAPEGRKMELIAGNPKAAFNIVLDLGIIEGEEACNWSCRYRSVVGHGRIRMLFDPEEKRRGLDIIMAQYSDAAFTYADHALRATAVYRLEITTMTAKESRTDS